MTARTRFSGAKGRQAAFDCAQMRGVSQNVITKRSAIFAIATTRCAAAGGRAASQSGEIAPQIGDHCRNGD